MTKTEKQLDKTLRIALTLACENIKDTYSDFAHLTHVVNLKKPANTLQVTCYFIDELALDHATSQQQLAFIETQINAQLQTINLKPKAINFTAV